MSAKLPDALDRLSALLARLPGVGRRSALRLAFHVLERPREEAQQLAEALAALHGAVGFCERCGHLATEALCGICSDPRRDSGVICVVEGVPDLLAVEATAEFDGTYHVLHGVLSPLRGVGPGELRLRELVTRVEAEAPRELILATSVSVEGEATAAYIQGLIRSGPELTRIATGVPQGSELEYIDEATLGRALKARRPL